MSPPNPIQVSAPGAWNFWPTRVATAAREGKGGKACRPLSWLMVVLRDAREARGQRSPAAPDLNKESRKATLVGDESLSAAFALNVLSFSQNYNRSNKFE